MWPEFNFALMKGYGLRNSSVHSTKTGVELADVVRRFGPKYTSQYGHLMMPSQKRALADIAACCTPEMGGSLYRCHDCDRPFWRFHCCRNRACPKCHGEQTRQGLEKRQAELLPCDYFHGVATVPSELHDAFRGDQKFMYGLDALKKHKPDLFATIPAAVWQREWVSFLKHYGHGNDAVLNYLSRYVFRTAIGNTRIDLPEADRHVRPAEDRGPTRNIGPTDGTLPSSDQPRG